MNFLWGLSAEDADGEYGAVRGDGGDGQDEPIIAVVLIIDAGYQPGIHGIGIDGVGKLGGDKASEFDLRTLIQLINQGAGIKVGNSAYTVDLYQRVSIYGIFTVHEINYRAA